MDPRGKKVSDEEKLKAQAAAQPTDENLQEECNEQETACGEPTSKEQELENQVEELSTKLEEEKNKYLRLSAEFDNYRKRTLKEKSELILNGGEKSITSILPVIDDLERALENAGKTDNIVAVKEGIELIYNKFISILGQNGVKVIETADKPLDTDYHEAIAVIPAPTEEAKGKILDTVQTGYTLNDKVIRHAKVVVGE